MFVRVASEVSVCQFGDHSSALRTLYESLHYQVRLIYVLYSAGVFAYGGGYGADAHRTSAELVDDSEQNLVVYLIKSVLVNVESLQCGLGYLHVNRAVATHLCEVAYTSQQSVGNTRRTA